MKRGLSGTMIVKQSKEEDGILKGLIPNWLIKCGGAALVLGGIGYLWYLNSSLRAYHQLNDEDARQFHFKLVNKLFPDYYLMGRTILNQIITKKIENPEMSQGPKFKDWLSQTQLNYADQNVVPLIERELKNSEFSKLREIHYRLKLDLVLGEVLEKLQDGRTLTEAEGRFKNLTDTNYLLSLGRFALEKLFVVSRLETKPTALTTKSAFS